MMVTPISVAEFFAAKTIPTLCACPRCSRASSSLAPRGIGAVLFACAVVAFGAERDPTW